ncbi:MAG TPA: acyltransferase [Kiritimatiellia bacterium]|nr:acyltransferase [Kiritimatiellia bacterium]HRZ12558.1 acyltransferase [Kiritimatiellia bacterium]HSA17636.1 acyltransferase [Kiritimatiellia bacterium]
MKAEPPSTSAARLLQADHAKGIAIALVVICHVEQGLGRAGIAGVPAFWPAFEALCYTFMVPVFFVLSGHFLEASIRRRGLKGVAASLPGTLLYPYVVWTLLQAALMILTGAGNRHVAWVEVPGLLLRGWMQFWFLHALMLIYALDLLLRGMRVGRFGRLAVALLLDGAAAMRPDWFGAPVRLACQHYLFLALGALAPERCFEALPRRQAIALAVAGFAGLYFLHAHRAACSALLLPAATLAGVAGTLGLSSLLAAAPSLNGWSSLGRYSLEVYCAHVIFSAGTRVVLQRGLHVSLFWPHEVAGVAAGLLLPLGLARVARARGWPLFRPPRRAP